MKYLSCHLLEHGLSIDFEAIKACCIANGEDLGLLDIYKNHGEKLINWDMFFAIKRMQREFQKTSVLPQCKGCRLLEEKDWDNEDYISHINFNHWIKCNSKCIYCEVRDYAKNNNINAYKSIKELIERKQFNKGGEITFQGGEPVLLNDFDKLVNLFLNEGCFLRIHSSGIKYSNTIAEGINKQLLTVVISIDSATRQMYKKIKQVDKFEKVVKNISKYLSYDVTSDKKFVKVKYIIIPDINDNINEINLWFELLNKIGIKNIIADVEYNYTFGHVINQTSKIYDLLDYMQKKSEQYAMNFELYDGAKHWMRLKENNI